MYEPKRSRGEQDFLRLLSSPQYERLREKLIRIFARRGCSVPEDLADETIARVMEKLSHIGANYEGDPIRYFFGVARNVFYEYTRRPVTVSFDESRDLPEPSGQQAPFDEETQACLDRCLAQLSAEERHIISEYYCHEKAAKISNRKALARSLGLGLNALRIKAFRIRQRLQRCVLERSRARRAAPRPRSFRGEN